MNRTAAQRAALFAGWARLRSQGVPPPQAQATVGIDRSTARGYEQRWLAQATPAQQQAAAAWRAEQARRVRDEARAARSAAAAGRRADYAELLSWGVPQREARHRVGVTLRTVQRWRAAERAAAAGQSHGRELEAAHA